MLTNEQFDRTHRLALAVAGIELAGRHRALLERRRRRRGIQDSEALDRLLGAAERGDASARRDFIGLLTTRFTSFFRHPWHFALAAEHALWAAHARGRARMWSAGPATGEEPYSLAMALLEVFRREDPPVSVLATDVDAEALGVAERGEYADRALEDLAPEMRAHFFEITSGSKAQPIPAVRRLVEFRETNLADPIWNVEGPFDVVFCRNVLMDLEVSRREGLVGLSPTDLALSTSPSK